MRLGLIGCLAPVVVSLAIVFPVDPGHAAERELEDTAPSSTDEIKPPIERVLPDEPPPLEPLIPGIRERLDGLPAFFSDAHLEARFRTYYFRRDQTVDLTSEAWALGGSVYYRSGWLADLVQIEAEGFTSQPLVAPDSRDGTGLLQSGQDGYTVLGIANAKVRYAGLRLTGYRQYLELPYVNSADTRMTPNTFESLVLDKPAGKLRFSGGYTWKIKRRTSNEFVSMSRAVGVHRKRGLAHAGTVWTPNDNLSIGAIGAIVPDLFAGVYTETGIQWAWSEEVSGRLDGQFTYQGESGQDLLEDALEDTWNLGIRAATSYAGAVLRFGISVTGDDGPILGLFGTNPTYVDLMQRTFNRADEKAFLTSLSYDFSALGGPPISAIVNFVVARDGRLLGRDRDAEEVDLTIDYRPKRGVLRNLWLRVRASWLSESGSQQDGTDVRVILRYDFPVI